MDGEILQARELGRSIYGVNVAFGINIDQELNEQQLQTLQSQLLLSHSAAQGDQLKEYIVRALIVAKLNTIAGGATGVRLETADHILQRLNDGIVPIVLKDGR